MRVYSFFAKFHANVQALHETTLEITCEERLTPRGDCVILTNSTHDPAELLRACPEGWEAALLVVSRRGSFLVRGTCSPLEIGCSFVLRKSLSRAPRTLMVGCDKSASDVPRQLVKAGRLWGDRALVILVSRPQLRERGG